MRLKPAYQDLLTAFGFRLTRQGTGNVRPLHRKSGGNTSLPTHTRAMQSEKRIDSRSPTSAMDIRFKFLRILTYCQQTQNA